MVLIGDAQRSPGVSCAISETAVASAHLDLHALVPGHSTPPRTPQAGGRGEAASSRRRARSRVQCVCWLEPENPAQPSVGVAHDGWGDALSLSPCGVPELGRQC
jgi:hypothetical protein